MSVIETLHEAHKARLKRMAARGVAQSAPETGSWCPSKLHVARPYPAPRYRLDRDYERAWAFEILGVVARDDRPAPRLKVEHIQRAAAQHFGISRDEMLSREHVHALSRPRHVAMYLARKLTTKSYPEIGRHFGGRDHATVLHAVRRIEDLLTQDAELAASVDHIRATLVG
jgi:hypothetical protein